MATVPCPYCAEPIQAEAVKCKHCGEWLDERALDTDASRTTTVIDTRSKQGSGGNVLAALASFFIPGLGQLLQGRLGAAIGYFLVACVLWVFILGWIISFVAAIDAAKWSPA